MDGNTPCAIREYITNFPQDAGFLEDIERYVLDTREVCRQIDDYRASLQRQFANEEYKNRTLHLAQLVHDKEKRASERRDMWKLWSQQTIRWIIGVILVILLYSCATAIHEKYGFIKIPIKDWLPEHKDLTDNAKVAPTFTPPK